eukprot:SAG31_NODE_546_length_14230_cov_18.112660_12_plen_145_part_00
MAGRPAVRPTSGTPPWSPRRRCALPPMGRAAHLPHIPLSPRHSDRTRLAGGTSCTTPECKRTRCGEALHLLKLSVRERVGAPPRVTTDPDGHRTGKAPCRPYRQRSNHNHWGQSLLCVCFVWCRRGAIKYYLSINLVCLGATDY